MDMVALRAKAGKAAAYCRWKSKADLVIDAVAHLKRTQVDLDALPDTGTLRGDLLGLFKPSSAREGERKMRVMAGLASVLSQHPELAEAGNAAIVEPWVNANLRLMQRALARGEICAGANIEMAAQVVPSMAAYRALIQRKPFELQFLKQVIDRVLLPALGIAPAAPENSAESDEAVYRTTQARNSRAWEDGGCPVPVDALFRAWPFVARRLPRVLGPMCFTRRLPARLVIRHTRNVAPPDDFAGLKPTLSPQS